MIIIDGKEFSKKILEEISNEQKEIVERKNLRPAGLAVIIVGENPASQVLCEK